ncbi:MAG: formylglycine-generating enzyme family protein [Planctomycetes bacterium]|nr:formylglycine-generating enzyme family protein [Planctomycetota bacterium]
MRTEVTLLSTFFALAGLLAVTASAVNIETVPVGNPGNAADTRHAIPGCGSVGYSYNIGKYEVTAGQYTAFLNAVAGVDTYGLYNTDMWSSIQGCKIERWSGDGTSGNPYRYRVASDYANRPVNYVSWGDAVRFANWLHNGQPSGTQDWSTTEDGAYYLNGAMTTAAWMAATRKTDWKWAIPNRDEWYKAAYHKNDGVTGNYWDYPTSSDNVPGRDMTEATNPGDNANYYQNGGPYPIDPPYYTTIAGEFELSQSPYGTLDQGGNLWEWNASWVSFASCEIWGGGFSSPSDYMLASKRCDTIATYEVYAVGFRIVEVPEPGSTVLLLASSLMLVRHRRRRT